MAVLKESYFAFVIREAITRAGSGCFQTELLFRYLVHGDSHSCGEAVTVIVLPSLVPAVVVRAPCRKFSTLRVRGTSLLCC